MPQYMLNMVLNIAKIAPDSGKPALFVQNNQQTRHIHWTAFVTKGDNPVDCFCHNYSKQSSCISKCIILKIVSDKLASGFQIRLGKERISYFSKHMLWVLKEWEPSQ